MALKYIDDSYLSDIADAIRAKNGSQDTYKPSEMADAIGNISGGGGITPTGTIQITENGTVDVTSYANANVNVGSNPYSIEVNSPYFLTMGLLQYISSVDRLLWDLSASSNSITRLTVITTEGSIDAYKYLSGTLETSTLQSGYHPIIAPTGATSMGVTITGICQVIIRRYTVVNNAITGTVYDSGWTDITSETELTTSVTAGEAVCISFRRNSSNTAFAMQSGWSEYPNNIRIRFYQ